jgi:flagellar hook-associated protein 2
MSFSLIQPLTFTGVSTYSSDFQSILSRAVQVAQIPLQILTNQQTDIQQEQTLTSSLSSAVAAVASSLGALGAIGSGKALSATSTDSSVVTASVTGTPGSTSYSITNVTSVAKAASESSLQAYSASAPVSQTGTLSFTFGGTSHTIQLGTGQTYPNTLTGLQNAINALNVGATASILTTASGNYLSISANNTGANTLTLVDDPGGANTTLLTSQNQGANTVFDINGVPVSEASTEINNVVPGLTLNFSGVPATNETIGLSLNSDPSQISSALQNLVTNYNALATQVNAQTGPSGGLLGGSSIIQQVRSAMLNIMNFTGGSGTINSLAALGVSMDDNGTMSFDDTSNPIQFAALSSSQINDAFSFLGSATTGFGGLQSQFSQISDPIDGSIEAQQAQYTATNTRLTDQISTMTDQINTMQANLQLQLAAADSLVASLQSQQSLLTSSIQALDYSTYGQQILSSQGV